MHRGRIVSARDGPSLEFRSVVDAVQCGSKFRTRMVERNGGVPDDRRIVFRIGLHLGDVVEESDGDLMGDGVNIAREWKGGLAGRDLPLRRRIPAGQGAA